MENDDDDDNNHPSNRTTPHTPSPPSSLFSLSFLRRRMDDDDSGSSNSNHRNMATPGLSSSFGPTIPADQAEAFSRSWMARSLPRNMRRQIDLAAQQAAEAHRQEHMVVDLPARMITQPEPAISVDSSRTKSTVAMDPDMPQQAAPSSSSSVPASAPPTTNRLFSSLPRQWRRKT
ncbi:hypothetical protein BCR42DRAFT_371188 [Absidia repens]|uniref:Uncharacterized protein n=1 Tax=Absidia repens TaxID=90262 RepID=A0A1X2ING9_9FUNG|nr:hypothetical protein BCR42DRAFT_371188 [Absidia repens]